MLAEEKHPRVVSVIQVRSVAHVRVAVQVAPADAESLHENVGLGRHALAPLYGPF